MDLKKMLLVVAALVIVALAALSLFVGYYGDWLWFQNMGFSQVFTTTLLAKVLAFSAFFLIFAIFAGANISIAQGRQS
jgi:uncharacterized membrane protein (UPF0182 family)